MILVPKGETHRNSSERNGDDEIKATRMAYKQANYVEDPEATLKFLPQLPLESAWQPAAGKASTSSTGHQQSGATYQSKR